MSQRLSDLPQAFVHAGHGLRHLLQSQRNARIHAVLSFSAILLAIGLRLPASEWAVLVLTIGVVLITEALNTAIEAVVDLVSPDLHPLAGIAKDTAAAAVLLSAGMAVMVGVFLFIPKLMALLL